MNFHSDHRGGIFFYSLLFLLIASRVPADTMVLPAPYLSMPINGGTITDRTPTFDWGDVATATAYVLQVDTQNTFPAPILDLLLTSSTYTPVSNLSAATYFWRVRARSATDSSVWSSASSFSIITTQCILLSPANNSELTDRTPSFDWSDAPGATGYNYQLSTDIAFTSLLLDLTTATSQYTVAGELSTGSYYWRARTRIDADSSAWTTPWTFAIILQPPVLLSPFNNSELTDHTPAFDWSDSPGAASYDFQLSLDAAFTSPVLDLNLPSSDYITTSDLLATKYYWRARAWVSGDSSSWTLTNSFTIIVPAPTLFFPANSSQTTDRTPTFDWNEPAGAGSYDLQVATNVDFSALVIGVTVTPSTYTPATDLNPGVYYWHVRIHPVTDSTRWCTAWQFTIIAAPQLLTFAINNGASATASAAVTLNHTVLNGPTYYLASENPAFTGAFWLPYSVTPSITLSPTAGVKTVYLRVKNSAGESNTLQDQIEYQPEVGVEIREKEKLPATFTMACHPNPFADHTTIRFARVDAAILSINIYDVMGRRVRTFRDAGPTMGEASLSWDGRDDSRNRLPAGIYYLRVRERAFMTGKILLLPR